MHEEESPFPQLRDGRWTHLSEAFQRKVDDLAGLMRLMKEVVTPKWENICGPFHKFFSQYAATPRFVLACLYSEGSFIAEVLPKMQRLALKLPELFPDGVKQLVSGESRELVLTKQQVACIVVHGFFMTFETRNTFEFPGGEWPAINFTKLFVNSDVAHEKAKLECILQYFIALDENDTTGKLKFKRQVVRGDALPDFENSEQPLTQWTLDSAKSIEDCKSMLQVDFANMYLGGGVIVGGCVQEEIRFSVCPELLAGCWLCEVMADDEAIIILGARQYSKYAGYAFSLRYDGPFEDTTPNREGSDFADIEICAIDAKDYRYERPEYQYMKEYITREIVKAYAGFVTDEERKQPVATGNWGCGAFLGDKFHKPFLQYLAASQAGRDMYYCTFKDIPQTQQLERCVGLFQESGWKVKDLWRAIMNYERSCCGNFADYLAQALTKEKEQKEETEPLDETK